MFGNFPIFLYKALVLKESDKNGLDHRSLLMNLDSAQSESLSKELNEQISVVLLNLK